MDNKLLLHVSLSVVGTIVVGYGLALLYKPKLRAKIKLSVEDHLYNALGAEVPALAGALQDANVRIILSNIISAPVADGVINGLYPI